MPRVQTGLSVFLENHHKYRHQNLGLLTNQASVGPDYRHALWHLDKILPGKIKTLFSPQHGFAGEKQDNMIESPHSQTRDGRPIYSLYGETRQPKPFFLEGLEAVLVDLPDMGTRVYTFAQTLSLFLEIAGQIGVEVVVLDRPNPIGGEILEGNLLDPDCFSFVGLHQIPMRHGLTLGELALYMNASQKKPAPLTIVPVKNWQRKDFFPETSLPWVMPSPNLPTPETAILYPGSVIFEGTLVSEGRGTTRPFHLIGAPYIDGELLAEVLNQSRLPGVFFRPVTFLPNFQKWQGQVCGGIEIHILDKLTFRAYLTGLSILEKILNIYPHHFQLKDPPYEYELTRRPIDLILGKTHIFSDLQTGVKATTLIESFACDILAFIQARKEFLLYP
ncbi:MAG: DUF1343 domain-containing protein [Deltaproteobacteria bacterium]|jgi:uncharacterized protein YbbC (DUF1343 family)|nr:DUF1343 domain-containing protein [Deltaproteobacteria bacterium]